MALPTALINVKQIFRLSLIISDTVRQRSAHEVYNLCPAEALPSGGIVPSSLSDAMAQAATIIGYRRAIMCAEARIYHARLTKTSSSSAAWRLNTGPLSPIAMTGESPIGSGHANSEGLCFRLGTLSGQRSHRTVPFLKDLVVTASALTGVTLSSYDSTSPPSVSGDGTGQADATTAWQAFMAVLQTKTIRAKKLASRYEIEPWNSCIFRFVADRNLGKNVAP